ncbi:MAG: hypothetical protein ACFFD4_16905 [Candidatus Odinarchaeota archaeon]
MSGNKLHSWILNHKGMTVHSQMPEESIKILHGEDEEYSWDNILVDIFASSNDDPSTPLMDSELLPVDLGEDYHFSPPATVFMQSKEGDLFIIASPEGTGSMVEEELQSLIELRKAMKDRFVGILFCDWHDEKGPVPVYTNVSVIDEVVSIQLAAQGISMAAMGQGSIPDHVVGPIPIPGSSAYQSLIYTFTRSDEDSEDPRIRVSGRPAVLYLIFRLEKIDKEVLELVEAFLYQWKAAPDLTKSGFENLSENLRLTVTFASDLVKSKEEQYRQLIARYHSDLLLLRQENLELKMELRKYQKKKRFGWRRKSDKK